MYVVSKFLDAYDQTTQHQEKLGLKSSRPMRTGIRQSTNQQQPQYYMDIYWYAAIWLESAIVLKPLQCLTPYQRLIFGLLLDICAIICFFDCLLVGGIHCIIIVHKTAASYCSSTGYLPSWGSWAFCSQGLFSKVNQNTGLQFKLQKE